MQNIKCLTVGDGSAGKSCLLITYTTNAFPQEYVPTVFDNYAANVMHEGQPYSLGLWDTAGQEDYDRLRPLSYPGSDVVLLCFSIASRDSFNNVREKWLPELRHYLPKVPIVLVGCKADLRRRPDAPPHICAHNAAVTHAEAQNMADELGLHSYAETSSAEHEGVGQCFAQALEAAVSHSRSKTARKKSSRGKGGAVLPQEPTAPVMPETGKAPYIHPDSATYSRDMQSLFGLVVETRGTQPAQSWRHDVAVGVDMGDGTAAVVKAHKVILASASPRLEEFLLHPVSTPSTVGADPAADAALATTTTTTDATDAAGAGVATATSAAAATPPNSFLCPISLDVMSDPVSTVDGHCYERASIERWLQTNDTSPKTGLKLAGKTITPAIGLRNAVEEWQQMYGDAAPAGTGAGAAAANAPSLAPSPASEACVTFMHASAATDASSGKDAACGGGCGPKGAVSAAAVNGRQWRHPSAGRLTHRSLQAVLEWLYAGTCTCPGVRRHGGAHGAPQQERPFTGTTDQARWLEEIVAAAAVFGCEELATFVNNVRTGDQWLNPSFATYLSDQTGTRAKDLFLGSPALADVDIHLDDGTRVPAHAALLAARCQHFREQLRRAASATGTGAQALCGAGDTVPEGRLLLKLPGVSRKVCRALLEFIYRDHCSFNEHFGAPRRQLSRLPSSTAGGAAAAAATAAETPFALLAAAQDLGLARLVSLCELHMTKVIDAAVTVCIETADIDLVGMLNSCAAYKAPQFEAWLLHFTSSNILAMKNRADWKNLSQRHLRHVTAHQWPPPRYLAEVKAYEASMDKWRTDVKRIKAKGRGKASCAIM